MAGLALTDNFMLSTATVMIGAAADLYDLNPTDHSIGLVKNFALTSEPAYTELQQGVKGTTVFSVMTSNPVRASMEVYEYTSRNLRYSLGLDGSNVVAQTVNTTVANPVATSPVEVTVDFTSATGFLVDDYVMFDKNGDDDFVVRKIVGISTNEVTVDQPLPALAAGTKVYRITKTDVGSKEDQPFLAAKIAGKAANGDPIVILIPKLRVTKGFNLSFITNDYGNLPFEFTMYDLVSTDVNYAAFGGATAQLFKRQ